MDCFWVKNLPPPNTTSPATASTSAPTRNAPIRAGFALRATLLPPVAIASRQEAMDLGVCAFLEERLWISLRDHRLRLRVQEHRVVPDGEDARQLVGHHHHGGAEAVSQLEDEVVQEARADGVESGRRLVEEEDVRVQGHGPGQAGPLAHAAADLGGIEVLEPGEPGQGELERGDLGDPIGTQVRVLAKRQLDVLRQRHGAPQGSALIQDAHAAEHPLPDGQLGRPEALAVVEHVASQGLGQPDHVPEERALAASAASHDHKDVAGTDGEAEIALDDALPVSHVDVADLDPGLASRGHHTVRRHRHGPQNPMMLKMTVISASDTMMNTMPVTTAEVAAAPTAAELRPHCMPRRQPAMATSIPKTEALTRPAAKSWRSMAAAVLA